MARHHSHTTKNPKGQKWRVERKVSKASSPSKQTRSKRESRRESAVRRELIKRNPRLASVFKKDADRDMDRTDQPRESIEWYLQKRLPKGEKQLPIERYFEAKEKIKRMKRFSTRSNRNLPPQAEEPGGFDGEDGEFPKGTGGGGAGDGSAATATPSQSSTTTA